METLDVLGRHKNTFAGYFAPDDHNHRHYVQHQFNKQREQTGQFDECLNHNEQRAANLSADAAATGAEINGHNSRDWAARLGDASSSPRSGPIEDDASRSQAFAASMLAGDCLLDGSSNRMQYSSEQGQSQTTNQSDCYISGADCEPLTDEDAFIAFCADSSSVLNNDLNRRYHVNKLYQPLDSSGPNQQRFVEQDDEFLLYQELKGLCEPGERSELSKMLDEDEDDVVMSTNDRLSDCGDLMGKDSLEMTSIIDSIEAFEAASSSPLIDSGPERASPLIGRFHCSSSSSPDKPDSSGRGNERSPLSAFEASDHCLGSFQNTNEADCYSRVPLHMELSRQHQQLDSSSYCYQTQAGADNESQPIILLDSLSSRPSTCEQSVFQDTRSETSSVFQANTTSSTPQPQPEAKNGAAGGGRASRRNPRVNHYRRRTANARERIRMREINQAFEKLKKVVPIELVREASEAEAASEQAAQEQAGGKKATKTSNNNQSSDSSPKLTKITTLRLAVSYISKLSSLLNDNPQGCSGSQTAQGNKKNTASTKSTNSKVTKDKSKRRSRAPVPKKPTSVSDAENKGHKKSRESESKIKSKALTPMVAKPEDDLSQKNAATPTSITAFNDANGFKRIDNNDEKPFKFENGPQMKVQQPILLTDSPLFNRTISNQQPQTAYIAIPHHQNQKQQYLTYQTSQQPQQQHSMISQTHFSQGQDRLLVAPMPVAILVSNLVYINPMRQGVRQQQQQQQFCLVNQQGVGSQQPQNGSSQAQVLTTKHVGEVKSVTNRMNDQTEDGPNNQDDVQVNAAHQPSFCQTKFVASQFARESASCQQQHQQQNQQHSQQQIRPDESLESNINKLVASLATSPATNTSDSQQTPSQAQQNYQHAATGNQPQPQQQQQQQQPVRTYRFHNYDGNIRL